MPRILPPLGALRAFEAAARHLSFTRGAAELRVTQGAVSHQVRTLERHLGIRLFRRQHRALSLTDEGQAYFPAVRDALDALSRATDRLRGSDIQRTLTVSALPSFAARWLVPRLGGFRDRHPEIDVRVAPEPGLEDFGSGDVDIAIRYGRGDYPGLRADRVLDEELIPVCSPRLLSSADPLDEPGDIALHTLLHDESHSDWRTWLLAAGVSEIDATRGPMFDDTGLLLQAAADGQGIALVRGALADGDLDAGRLVRLFDRPLPADFAYYLVCPDVSSDQPKVEAFRAWMLGEVGESHRGTRVKAAESIRRWGE